MTTQLEKITNWATITVGGWIDKRWVESFDQKIHLAEGRPIRLWIDSPGGVLADAFDLFFKLQRMRPLMTVAYGRCESAATIIFMAGNIRVIHERARFMVHNPRLADGTPNPVRHADDIAHIRSQMIGLYVKRTGLERETVVKLMEAETFLSPDDALSLGFAHRIARSKPRDANSIAVNIPIVRNKQ